MYSHETKSYAAPTKTGGYRLFYDGVEANSVRPQAREIHVCLHKDQTQAAIIAPIRQGEMKMRQALVVVDYQKDFVDGSLGFSRATALEDAICAKIEAYHAKNQTVIFTLDTHDDNYLKTQEGRKLPIPHCAKHSAGWQLYGRVAVLRRAEDPTIEKPGFGSLALAEHLRCANFDQIEFVGLVSYICVISNAVLAKAALPEAEIIVDAACTAGADHALHEEALHVMEGLQITVKNRQRPE